MKTLVEHPGYLFIPKWQFKNISKNVVLKDRIMYKDLRSALSIIDMAELIALNNNITFNGNTLSWSFPLDNFLTQPTDEERLELDKTIIPLSNMSDTISDIQSKLTAIDNATLGDDKPYKIIGLPTIVIIVVDKPFLTYISTGSDKHKDDNSKSITFIEDVLKSMYKITSQAYVARTEIFKLYLEML